MSCVLLWVCGGLVLVSGMVLHGCGYIQFETGNTQVQTALISPSFDFSNFHQSGDGVRGLSSLKVKDDLLILFIML